MLKPNWLKEDKVQAKGDERMIVQAELGERTISSRELNELVSQQPILRESSSRTKQIDYHKPSFDTYILARDQERKATKAPIRLRYKESVANALSIGGGDPIAYKEAINFNNGSMWIAVMEEKLKSLHKNKTWDLVELPKDKSAIGCKWVFQRKEALSEKDEENFKAQLLAKGHAQREGEGYNKTFSPVVKHTSIQVLLAIVVLKNHESEELNVKTTFLHGDLEEQIYMHQLEGLRSLVRRKWCAS